MTDFRGRSALANNIIMNNGIRIGGLTYQKLFNTEYVRINYQNRFLK